MEKRVLIERWLGRDAPALPIYDEASVSSSRQRVREAGQSFGASQIVVETAALIASELTHNQLAHAKQGYFHVRTIERDAARGLEVTAADLGPGLGKTILNTTRTVMSAGNLGAGLEGVFRLADEVDVDTRREEGLCVVVRKFAAPIRSRWEFAIAGIPYPGEIISGDDALCLRTDWGFMAAVFDGLGHGPEARQASNRAAEEVAANVGRPIDEVFAAVNAALIHTRGCALGLLRYETSSNVLQSVLAGDVRAQLYRPGGAHFFTATPFVVGERRSVKRKVRMEEVTAEAGSVLVVFTDGLETKTSLRPNPDVLRRPAIQIAQYLLETHSRGNDDSLVLAVRFKT